MIQARIVGTYEHANHISVRNAIASARKMAREHPNRWVDVRDLATGELFLLLEPTATATSTLRQSAIFEGQLTIEGIA